jgi:GH24 family phage-related lysozyme (muramidase)
MNSNLSKKAQEAANFYDYSGPMEPGMLHLLEEEGFVAGQYEDDVGVDTFGVGQTAENKGKNFFTETYPKYVARAHKLVKGLGSMPQETQNAVLSAVYRGDMGPETAKLLSAGRFKEAADEYLNHAEYKKRRDKDPEDGVVLRMERNADAIAAGEPDVEPRPRTSEMAGGGIRAPRAF